jgi:hypothetical protein
MSTELIGTWKLMSAVMEDVESKVQTRAWGERPTVVLFSRRLEDG